MNTSKLTFGMLNVVAASVLVANVHFIKPMLSATTNINPAPKENQPDQKTETPNIFLDKINVVFPKKRVPRPDLFKKQKNIITFNTNPTPGLVFRVQIMASKTQVPLFAHEFNGLDNLKEEYVNGLYKYTVGEFKTPVESENTFYNLEKKGFDDTFLVAYKDGKPVNMRDAIVSLKKR